MRFHAFDSLRVFEVVARHGGFASAASELSLTKGAVSYHIKQLETALGFKLFIRRHRGVQLTRHGEQLSRLARSAFDELEAGIGRLRTEAADTLTVGLSSYFASRWLSPRLMTFIAEHPGIALRLQPLVDVIDLSGAAIDMVIRWGNGRWDDLTVEPLFVCPAFATSGAAIAEQVREHGLERTLAKTVLLHDREGSEAWLEWHRVAGIPYRSARHTLVIPDPNVRVQAVIDDQGIALNDSLVQSELDAGKLVKLADTELGDYGYFLAYPLDAMENPALRAFRDWIVGLDQGER